LTIGRRHNISVIVLCNSSVVVGVPTRQSCLHNEAGGSVNRPRLAVAMGETTAGRQLTVLDIADLLHLKYAFISGISWSACH